MHIQKVVYPRRGLVETPRQFRRWIAAVLALGLSACGVEEGRADEHASAPEPVPASSASDQSTAGQNSEGPFDLRALGNRGQREPEAAPEPLSAPLAPGDPGLLFDEEGRSNELIVQLNHRDTVAQWMSIVQQRDRRSSLALGSPVAARPLTPHPRPGTPESHEAMQSPAEARLEQYLVLRYPSVEAALHARTALGKDPAVGSVTVNMKAIFSWAPNDPYFQLHSVFGGGPEAVPTYQWGPRGMNFPLAWDKARGFSHVGIIDGGYPGVVTKPLGAGDYDFVSLGVILHDDMRNNYRQQFDAGPLSGQFWSAQAYGWHATHVAGIIAASANNSLGVTGGCPSCSLTAFRLHDTTSWVAEAQRAVDAGMQVLNWSGELGGDTEHTDYNCSNQPSVCTVIQLLKERDILLVQAAGNFRKSGPPFPSNLPPLNTTALPVGGTSITQPLMGRAGSLWIYDSMNGSSWPGLNGVLGPAKSIVSTVPKYSPAYDYNPYPHVMCGDRYAVVNGVVQGADESGSRFSTGSGDGYGSCTGTSMAAPHISALAGLVRSIHPLLSASSIRELIQNSGNLSGLRTSELGAGLPNALSAVNAAIATNPRRLTPLFSFYSPDRIDSFYTTVPQMAAAALGGTLKPQVACTSGMTNCVVSPKYGSSYGTGITSHGASGGAYSSFPGMSGPVVGPSLPRTPLAEVWIFTTHENPKSASIPLVPLYRLSWKCDDTAASQRPAICASRASHTDTTYTADPAGITAFQEVGYKLDGIEGYIYPKTMPQPPGTVRLMRKYNPTRDDHAIFPEAKLGSMVAQGYTLDSGSDWLGYVYPNTGPVPVIQ